MGDFNEVVDSIEQNLGKLMHRLEMLVKANEELKEVLSNEVESHKNTLLSLDEWKEKYNSLKLASSMLGSDINKTEAKYKINTLIRELDSCIAQLSE